MSDKVKNERYLMGGVGGEGLKGSSAGFSTIGVWDAVVHVHNVDGKKGKVRSRESRRGIKSMDFLKEVESVSAVFRPTEEGYQGIENTVEPHGSSRVRAMDRGNDTSEGRKFIARKRRLVDFGEAVEVGASDLPVRDSIESFVVHNVSVEKSKTKVKGRRMDVRCRVRRFRSVSRGVGNHMKDGSVVVSGIHDNHSPTLIRLTDGERMVVREGP